MMAAIDGLTLHTPPITRRVAGDQQLIIRTVLSNGRVPERVALPPMLGAQWLSSVGLSGWIRCTV